MSMSIEKKARQNGIDLHAKHWLNQVADFNKIENIAKNWNELLKNW